MTHAVRQSQSYEADDAVKSAQTKPAKLAPRFQPPDPATMQEPNHPTGGELGRVNRDDRQHYIDDYNSKRVAQNRRNLQQP